MTTAPATRKTLILAGDYAQFRHYCQARNLNPREVVYLARPDQDYRGYEKPVLIRVGTWYRRNDCEVLGHLERQGYFSEVINDED